MNIDTQIVKFIAVVGFHHIRGYEVEYIYPSIDTNNGWITKLPPIAMPDGVHKLDSDIFYFILPKTEESSLFYGIGCFGQIASKEIVTKSGDIVRNTVQKTLVLLCEKPYFQSAGALLSSVIDSYFDRQNFANNEILKESFEQFNEHFKLVIEDRSKRQPEHVAYGSIFPLINEGFLVSEAILQFEHELLIIFKLLMLQKKIVFLLEPASKVTKAILTLVSLFPGILTSDGLHKIGKFVYDESPIRNDELENPKTEADSQLNDCEVHNVDSNSVVSEHYEETSTVEPEEAIDLSSDHGDTIMEAVGEMKHSTSWLDSLKMQGGQAIKVAMSMTTSGTSDTTGDTQQQPHQQQFGNMLPPFLADSTGATPDSDQFHCVNSEIDTWGFPLGLYDENNVLLPYADLSFLNILTNKNIESFVIGVNNQLWPMKIDKYDALIRSNPKSNSHIFFSKPSSPSKNNPQSTSILSRIVQLTVADRRFIDFLLQVVKKWHQKSTITTTITSRSSSKNDLLEESNNSTTSNTNTTGSTIHTVNNNAYAPEEDNLPTFTDIDSLEEWLRNALIDYLKALLITATGQGSRESYEDYGVEFIRRLQHKSYFKSWYYCADINSILTLNRSSFLIYKQPNSSSLVLNLSAKETPMTSSTENIDSSSSKIEDSAEMNNCRNIPLHLHPGRLIQSRIGDNLPGYYQFRNYADQSKALVNKSVSEIKRIGGERGSQLKSQFSSGMSKLSLFARNQSAKLATSSAGWLVGSGKDKSPDQSETNNQLPLQPITDHLKEIKMNEDGVQEYNGSY